MGDELKGEVPVAEAQAVPVAQKGSGNPLETMNGLLIVQDFQCLEFILHRVCGLYCFEQNNKYGIAPLPSEQTALKSLKGPGWRPDQTVMTNTPKPFYNNEDAACCTKCMLAYVGCVNFRPFTMDMVNTAGAPTSYAKIVRPFTWGGCCCCPHTADVQVGGETIGRVVEDWNCNNPVTWIQRYLEAYFCCRVPYDLQVVQGGQFVNKYRVNLNFCACGPHVNFCGSTPCCNDMLWDVVPYQANGTLSATPGGRIQKTYGGCSNINALGRWYCGGYSNWIVDWAPDATVNDRALIMGATTLFEYVYFERVISQAYYLILAIGAN